MAFEQYQERLVKDPSGSHSKPKFPDISFESRPRKRSRRKPTEEVEKSTDRQSESDASKILRSLEEEGRGKRQEPSKFITSTESPPPSPPSPEKYVTSEAHSRI